MPSWPQISWDSGDLFLLSASLDYLEKDKRALSRYRKVAQLPLMVLGAPGGWALYPTVAFYAALVSLAIEVELGGVFAPLSLLSVLMIAMVLSWSYGTLRNTKQSLIRLQVLRILRSRTDTWRKLVVGPVATYLQALSGYKEKPGRVKRYLNRIRSLNRADELFERYSRTLMALSLLTGVTFLFARGAVVALTFLASVTCWMAIIPISIVVSAWAGAVRNDVPMVWQSEDLEALADLDRETE